jgi:hypothetical protein
VKWNYNGKSGGEDIFREAIGSLQNSISDWSPAFRDIGGILSQSVDEQFESQGHGEWQELAESTIRQKGHDTILFRNGGLRRSFQPGGADHVENISPKSMQWGSTLGRALFMQTGTLKGFQQTRVATGKGTGRGMAMRKILESDNSLTWVKARNRAMRSALVRHMANAARRAGFAALSSQTDVDPLTARMAGSRLLGL